MKRFFLFIFFGLFSSSCFWSVIDVQMCVVRSGGVLCLWEIKNRWRERERVPSSMGHGPLERERCLRLFYFILFFTSFQFLDEKERKGLDGKQGFGVAGGVSCAMYGGCDSVCLLGGIEDVHLMVFSPQERG